MKIGFFDSGIGGITVLHQALKYLPNEEYLFYADTLHVPYGEKPKEEVRNYIYKAVEFLANQGIDALVIACNTATSIAVEDLREIYDFPILGIEPAVKPAVQSNAGKHKKVLVLATNLTLSEQKFHNLLKNTDKNEMVDSIALPGLVHFAENFEFREEVVLPYLKDTFSALYLDQYGTVLLGCTHFPYFEDTLKKLFSKDIKIISGSNGTAKNLNRILQTKGVLKNDSPREIIYFNTGKKVEDKDILANYNQLYKKLDEIQN
jgi:glutamate racemase